MRMRVGAGDTWKFEDLHVASRQHRLADTRPVLAWVVDFYEPLRITIDLQRWMPLPFCDLAPNAVNLDESRIGVRAGLDVHRNRVLADLVHHSVAPPQELDAVARHAHLQVEG